MRHQVLAIAAMLAAAIPASAVVKPFPSQFAVHEFGPEGERLHVRVGGHGPAVLLLHGFGDTGDMWEPLAVELSKDHTVIVPDLRGMGLSDHPTDGYEKKAQANDLAALLRHLNVTSVDLVSHDIGNMVGYALAVQNPGLVKKWVAMDAPLPGLGHWEEQLKSPKTWHFNFHGPDEERLVAGRERIFLDRFYNELSDNPAAIDEQTRRHYAALYARAGAMHDALEQFAAFPKDARDNKAFLEQRGKLAIPVLAIGGRKSYGADLAGELGYAAVNVRSAVVEGAGHWLMEEQPQSTVTAILGFLEAK